MKLVVKKEIDSLLSLQRVSMKDKQKALEVYRTYVNKTSIVCLTCPSSVRHMFTQLKTWWSNVPNYKFITKLD